VPVVPSQTFTTKFIQNPPEFRILKPEEFRILRKQNLADFLNPVNPQIQNSPVSKVADNSGI